MGMSTHVIGFRPPDEKWHHMKAIWDACAVAEIDPPKMVQEFFNWMAPDPAGVEVEIQAKEWTDNDMSRGLEIDVASLPKDIATIRFINSW